MFDPVEMPRSLVLDMLDHIKRHSDRVVQSLDERHNKIKNREDEIGQRKAERLLNHTNAWEDLRDAIETFQKTLADNPVIK